MNTGADRSRMMLSDVKEKKQYLPSTSWDTIGIQGRELYSENLANIETDFVDAFYTKHVAFFLNTKRGLNTYFTSSAQKNIVDIINTNILNDINIEETTLSHHIKVYFFSEDGTLIALKDSDVHEYKRVFQNDSIILEVEEISDYKCVMLLEDGYWKIRHLVKENTRDNDYQPIFHKSYINMKGMNYYPKDQPWKMYGKKFAPDVIDKDFAFIKASGLNSIRIFVPYEAFGGANVNDIMLKQLHTTMNLAYNNDLKVMVTLFDFYGNYDMYDWTLNQRHTETIVNKLKDHPALMAWDIKNEPDLDMPNRGENTVRAWLRNMIRYIKTIDPNTPVTIGWSSAEAADDLVEEVDFVSFHFYLHLPLFEETYLKLKEKVGDKQVVVQEFGLSSYDGFWFPFGNDELDQAEYHKTMQKHFKKYNLSFVSWTLYDFEEVPNAVLGWKPWLKSLQKHYGFVDYKGRKKPAFKYIAGPN